MYGRLSKASGSLAEMFSHRWDHVLVGIVIVGFFAFLLIMHGERSSYEETSMKNVLSD